jgi:hypothetical protein
LVNVRQFSPRSCGATLLCQKPTKAVSSVVTKKTALTAKPLHFLWFSSMARPLLSLSPKA